MTEKDSWVLGDSEKISNIDFPKTELKKEQAETVQSLIKMLGSNKSLLEVNSIQKHKESTNSIIEGYLQDIIGYDPAFFSKKSDEIEKVKNEMIEIRNRAIENGLFQFQNGKLNITSHNGNVSKLNERTWLITQLESFKKWFRNSKVVDTETQEPLVCVRGTDEDISIPNTNRVIDEKYGKVQIGEGYKGMFFSDSKKYSKAYGNLNFVFLNIENPEYLQEIDTEILSEREKSDFSMYDGFIGDEYGVFDVKEGKPVPVKSFVVLKPNQVKSIRNIIFDINDSNIYH